MTDRVQPVPEGVHTVTPRLVFDNAAATIEFYRDAFGAEVPIEPHTGPGEKIVHAEIRVGDSLVHVTDEDDEQFGVAPATAGGRVTAIMAITVPDVDRLWERAVAAGCEVVFPLADQFYGDRAGRLRDPFGHQWMLSMHIEDVDRAEMDRRMQAWSENQT
jgi:PhnB protein